MKATSERGMVSAELAIAIPAVIAVLMLIVSFGQALVSQMRVADAAREAVRAVAIGDDAAVDGLVRARAGQSAKYDVAGSGDTVEVTVTAPISGIGSLLDLEATASSTARREGR